MPNGNSVSIVNSTYFGPGTAVENYTTVSVRSTRVRTKAGWLGQVVVHGTGEILWESKPRKTEARAQKAAEEAQLESLRDAFGYLEV